MSNHDAKLRIFGALQPLGQCGICGALLYPMTTLKGGCGITCPLRGREWAEALKLHHDLNDLNVKK
jgi:hypothetical protein